MSIAPFFYGKLSSKLSNDYFNWDSFMLLQLPCSSSYVPEEYTDLFNMSDVKLDEYLRRESNLEVLNIFSVEHDQIKRFTADVSSLLIDLRHSRKYIQESAYDNVHKANEGYKNKSPLSRLVKWFHKRTANTFKQKKRVKPTITRKDLSSIEVEGLLKKFYDTHYNAIDQAIQNELNTLGTCLIIDCHVFSDESASKNDSVDFYIEVDSFHMPEDKVVDVCRFLSKQGYTYEVIHSTSASIVLNEYYHNDARVKFMTLRVNKQLDTNIVKSNMDKLLPYFACDEESLLSNDFDGDTLYQLIRIDDWDVYEIALWGCYRLDSDPHDDPILTNGWEMSTNLTFSSPSCDTSITLWVNAKFYNTKDNIFHSVDVQKETAFDDYPRPIPTVQVDGCLYFFDGYELIISEGNDAQISNDRHDLENKLLNVAKNYYQTELKNQDLVAYFANRETEF